MQASEFDSSDEEPIEDEQTPIPVSWYVNISDQWWAKIFGVHIIIFIERSPHIENIEWFSTADYIILILKESPLNPWFIYYLL